METKKLNIFEKISLWWKFDGKYMHKEFARGVKNLWKWLPTIWKDRDWDDSFIFEILRVKLENQAKYIGGRGIHVSAKRDAEKMRLVAKLIKLQQDDFYHMEYLDYQKTEYEFVPTDDTKKWYTMEDTLISENYDDYFKKYPRIYKEVLSEENFSDDNLNDVETKSKIAFKIAYKNQDRCKNLIFKIMSDQILNWWD